MLLPRKMINVLCGHRFIGPIVRPALQSLYDRKDAIGYRRLEANQFRPNGVYAQISRRCNLTCSMCGWKVWKRNKGFMSFEIFNRIVDDMTASGIKNLELSSAQGEPLLHPKAETLIQIALNAGLIVHLNTNCTTLGERNISTLAAAAETGRFSVQTSFSGYDKASHESVYVGSKFDDTSKKLASLYAEFSRRSVLDKLTINGIVMDPATMPKHFEYLKSLGISRKRVSLHHPDNFAGLIDLGKRDQATGISTMKTLPLRSRSLCWVMAYYLVVYDDGKVSACACRDSEGAMEIGDITKETLIGIRNGPRFRKMIDSFKIRDLSDLELCQKCDMPYI
jgi:uncharacterized Fe-S cluster-containing radical SAM superfamily protein